MLKILIGVIVAAVVVLVTFQFIDPHLDPGTNFDQPTSQVVDATTLTAAIDGEIKRPGRYTLDQGETLANLIDVAQGITTNADKLAYDPTYVLEDGLTFYIARKFDTTDVCATEPIEKVNINAAEVDEFIKIDGIGETLAKAIISYREEQGFFRRIEDLKKVSGIGNATFNRMKDRVTLRSE